jgi:transglutaminase-like putative cysteine protease
VFELLDSAAVGLHRGYGDCDLKARLFVALCLACGVAAEIEPVFKGETGFPHVRARVLTETSETGGERWETADPTIVNSTIGHLPRKALTAFPREAA